KFALYYLLQKYRVSFGGNYRTTVILGVNKKTLALETFFNKNPEYGYIHKKTFNFRERDLDLLECFDFINNEAVDEIYCSISELTISQLREIIDYVENNLKIIRFLTDNKTTDSKELKYDL